MLAQPERLDLTLDGRALRSISDKKRLGRRALRAQPRDGVQQIAVSLLGSQRGAQTDDVIIRGEAQALAHLQLLLLGLDVGKVFDIDAVMNDTVRGRSQASLAPIVALVLADVEEQIGALEELLIQKH